MQQLHGMMGNPRHLTAKLERVQHGLEIARYSFIKRRLIRAIHDSEVQRIERVGRVVVGKDHQLHRRHRDCTGNSFLYPLITTYGNGSRHRQRLRVGHRRFDIVCRHRGRAICADKPVGVGRHHNGHRIELRGIGNGHSRTVAAFAGNPTLWIAN